MKTKRRYIVESVFEHSGLKCAVTLNCSGYRCGYVGVPKTHPLYLVDYSEKLNRPDLSEKIKTEEIGKRGIIPLFCWDGEDISPELLFNVHGGLTYSGKGVYPVTTKENTWWFGFDCAHCDDAEDWAAVQKVFHKTLWDKLYEISCRYSTLETIRTKEYCEQECRNLAEQLVKFKKRRP